MKKLMKANTPTKDELVEVAHRRAAMPVPSALQSCYVRYNGLNQNLAANWDARHSPARSSASIMPSALRWSIVEAPAEWLLPLRTDKYIKPGFKLRVEAVHSQALSLMLHTQVYLLSEQEAENIMSWDPAKLFKDVPATPPVPTTIQSATGAVLKGTLGQVHVMDSASGKVPSPPPDPTPTSLATWAPTSQPPLTPQQPSPSMTHARANSSSSLPIPLPARAMTPPTLPMPGGLGPAGLSLQQLQAQRVRALSQGLGLPMNSTLLHKEVPGSATLAGLPMDTGMLAQAAGGLVGGDYGYDSTAIAAYPARPATPSALSCGSVTYSDRYSAVHSSGGAQTACAAGTGGGRQGGTWFPWTVTGPQPLEVPPGCHVTHHDFLFTDLRFAKPSRMSPVYIVFCCQLPSTGDTLISLYSVPTISTCRAEQWRPAISKLGMVTEVPTAPQPLPSGASTGPGAGLAHSGVQGHPPGYWQGSGGSYAPGGSSMEMGSLVTGLDSGPGWVGARSAGHAMQACMDSRQPASTALGNSAGFPQQSLGWPSGAGHGSGYLSQPGLGGVLCQGGSVGGLGLAQGSPLPGHEPSVGGLVDWIVEEYAGTGLTRRLTQADIQALVALAGLDDARAVSLMPQHQLHAQIAHFVRQFRTMTALLRHVSGLWNACQPCIVAGFEVGRDAAVRALAAQPPGTFLCRLSMSAATGGLALAVRAAPGHPQTGPDGVLHVLITQADLGSQRVDTLIRDYAGATHLLDVYSGKRVDKRKIFATNYTHVRKLEDVAPPPPPHPQRAVDGSSSVATEGGRGGPLLSCPQSGAGGLGSGPPHPAALPWQPFATHGRAQAAVEVAGQPGQRVLELDGVAQVAPHLPGMSEMKGEGCRGGGGRLTGETSLLLDSLPLLPVPSTAAGDPWAGMGSISDILLNTDEQAMVSELIDAPL